MKAIVQQGYGSPDVLSLREIEVPGIGERDVLVNIHAASVNALDWHTTRGMPFLVRIGEGLRTPRHRVRGVDLAGRVVAVGNAVARFTVGDEVFGGCDGSFAEYAATTEDRLARKPATFTFEQAAALHVAGMTALQGLRDRAQLQPGQRVLINGAGGGVGIFAVQIAGSLGAHVTAVTRRESFDNVRSAGADEVVDHDSEDFTRRREKYDVIFDIGGNRSIAHLLRVLKPRGTLIPVGGPAGRWLAPATRMIAAVALSPFVGQRIVPFISKNDAPSLARLAELAESGRILPILDRQYMLSEAAAAIRHVGEGRARGKVIIRIQ